MPQSDRTSGWLHVEAKKAGKTTLTIAYRFVGKYGAYEAEQVVEMTVIGDSNPIASIECVGAAQVPMIAECAICGEPHGAANGTIIPIELVAQDPSRPYTSDQVIEAKSSNEDVMWVGGDSCPEGDGKFHLHVVAKTMGEATVSITASTSNGDDLVQTASAMLMLITVDAGKPSLMANEPGEKRAFSIDDPWYSRSIAVEHGLASYAGNDLPSMWPYCPNIENFDGFKGMVNGKEVTVLSAQSDNEDIAAIVEDDNWGGHRLVFSKGGTVHVTLKDIWGNEEKVTAIGVCREDEAKKLSLSRNEITIKQGETVDVQNLVQGLDTLDSALKREELLVFKSEDKGIASVEWRQEQSGSGQVSWITGKTPGDVTVRAGIRKLSSYGSAQEADTWPIVEFGTLTVHVVASETPEIPATGISITESAYTVTVGHAPVALKAKVTPSDADGAITWSSSDTKVATVDASGVVTVKAAGSATITAKCGAVSATCKLTVNSRQITVAPQESGFAASVIVSDAETARALDKYADEGVNLIVESIAELTEPAKAAIEKLTESGSKVADTFDIRFEKDNGDTIILSTDKDGKVTLTVKVALTGSMRALLNQGMALKVHYVGPDGTIEEKQTWVEGDSLYFVTEHFSDYVVMGVPQDQKGEKPATTPASLPGGSTDDGVKTLAATGDASASLLAVLSAAALIACCGVVIAVRKRKTER